MTEIRTRVLALADEQDLRTSLPTLLHAPWRSYPGLTEDQRANYWQAEIHSVLSSPGGAAFVAQADGKTPGLAVVADQVWETQALGRRVMGLRYLAAAGDSSQRATILDRLLGESVRYAEEHDAECLVHRSYADDAPAIHALERRGFLLVDTLLDYVWDVPPGQAPDPAPLPPDVRVRVAMPEDLGGLLEVSRRAFATASGRFHSDEKIPHTLAVRVYEEWIRSCMEGWADWVLVAESEGTIVGYSAWKTPSEIERRCGILLGHYSIGAVVPEYASRGLFRALTREGTRLLAAHARRIEGPTHATNVPVQRAYAALGWRVADARHGFHRWSKG